MGGTPGFFLPRGFVWVELRSSFKKKPVGGRFSGGGFFWTALRNFDWFWLKGVLGAPSKIGWKDCGGPEKNGESLSFFFRVLNKHFVLKIENRFTHDGGILKGILWMNNLPNCSNKKIDGLCYFTPVLWTQFRLRDPMKLWFKWKPLEKNYPLTFSWRGNLHEKPLGVNPGPLAWRLYVQEKGKLFFESEIPQNRISDEPWFEDGAIVECRYITWESPMWWKPLKRRRDKTHPNNRRM
jgi:hypothetical protein